jgi:hypothetical protein
MAEQDLDAALTNLAQIKNEHREILKQIASDPGMAPETRTSLIAHLYEEEDEHLAEIQAMRAGPVPTAHSTPAPAAPSAPGLTVGSLRANPAPIHVTQPASLSVGSLRR